MDGEIEKRQKRRKKKQGLLKSVHAGKKDKTEKPRLSENEMSKHTQGGVKLTNNDFGVMLRTVGIRVQGPIRKKNFCITMRDQLGEESPQDHTTKLFMTGTVPKICQLVINVVKSPVMNTCIMVYV
jgi:hypothetical protein